MFDELKGHLQRIDRRRRWRDAFVWLPRGVLAGLLLAAVVATWARLQPLLTNAEVIYVALGFSLCGLILAAVILWAGRRSLLEKARFADHAFSLRERASAAVEIEEGLLAAPPNLARLQLADAVHTTGAVDVESGLPLRLYRRDWLVLFLALALLALAVWLPNPQADILRTERSVEEKIGEQVEEIEALTEEIEENPALTQEQRQELLEPLQSALEALQAGDLSREEAVAALSEAEAELRDLQSASSTEALRRELQEAGQALADNAPSRDLGRALESGNLGQAAQSAADLAADLPRMSREEQRALAQALAQTAESLSEVDAELAQEMAQASEALQRGDETAAQEALREAAATLQRRAQERAAAQQAASAAEQLSEGRQEVAQAGTPGAQGQEGQAGAQGQGSGQGPNQGEGQGNGAGQGGESGQGDGGPGSGNEGGGVGGQAGGTGGETGHAEEVFVPDPAGLGTEPGQDVELPAECLANPQNCGPLLSERPSEIGDERSTVPYSEVFGDYRDAAYNALEDEPIPLGLKGYIREYFSSLEP